jgi:hypothetical protein
VLAIVIVAASVALFLSLLVLVSTRLLLNLLILHKSHFLLLQPFLHLFFCDHLARLFVLEHNWRIGLVDLPFVLIRMLAPFSKLDA